MVQSRLTRCPHVTSGDKNAIAKAINTDFGCVCRGVLQILLPMATVIQSEGDRLAGAGSQKALLLYTTGLDLH